MAAGETVVAAAAAGVLFVIAAVAMVLYLKRVDTLRLLRDTVEHYDELQVEWEAERAQLLKDRRKHDKTLADAALKGLGGGPDEHREAGAPPLPLQEGTTQTPADARRERKHLLDRLLRLHCSDIRGGASSAARWWYARWVRWVTIRKVAPLTLPRRAAAPTHVPPVHSTAYGAPPSFAFSEVVHNTESRATLRVTPARGSQPLPPFSGGVPSHMSAYGSTAVPSGTLPIFTTQYPASESRVVGAKPPDMRMSLPQRQRWQ
eukprot:TRINITY_DN18502_c0_g1_i1.p1 TRINITY_DN18502_c0_g1~~TRINITY_DN18502_c0_g1_i1.p1  ORF type:complete len:261 (+),score=30.84 TRINITY_DN18502_c0_g1_i1:107-889(+)